MYIYIYIYDLYFNTSGQDYLYIKNSLYITYNSHNTVVATQITIISF